MKRRISSRKKTPSFAPCPCGRKSVLLYRRAVFGEYIDNLVRYAYHDTPSGFRCPQGGETITCEQSSIHHESKETR